MPEWYLLKNKELKKKNNKINKIKTNSNNKKN